MLYSIRNNESTLPLYAEVVRERSLSSNLKEHMCNEVEENII